MPGASSISRPTRCRAACTALGSLWSMRYQSGSMWRTCAPGKRSWRDGKKHRQRYERGKPAGDLEEVGKARKTGTRVTFLADSEIFEDRTFSLDTLSNRLREVAVLNNGLRIRL